MKRQNFFKSMLCLLLGLMCHVAWAAVTPPTFSTEDAPVWYYIQFKTGSNLLNAPDANAKLKTISLGDRSATTRWILVGTEESFYLKNANGDYVGWSGSRFTATTEANKVMLKISEQTTGFYDIQRTASSGKGMNQWGGTGAGVELGEYDLKDSNNALSFVSCTSVSSPALPLFSTEDAPEWYMIQFTAGSAVLSDQGAGLQVTTAAKAITEANLWQFVGTKQSFYLKSYKGNYLYRKDDGKYATTASADGKTLLALDERVFGQWDIHRPGVSSGLNQVGGAGTGKELSEWTAGDTNNQLQVVSLNAPTITNLLLLSNNKVYTLRSKRAQLYYSDASKVSSSNSIAYDRNDPNQQFRIEKRDGKYYLYSVGAQKYLKGDGTYVDNASDAAAVTMHDVSGTYAEYPWKVQLESNYLNSQNDGSLVINTYSATDEGNSYKIELGNIYSVRVLGAGDVAVTVTCKGRQYKDGDVFAKTEEITKSDITAPEIDGKHTVVYVDGGGIYVSYVDNDTQFYTVRNGKGGYISLNPDYMSGSNLLLSNTSRPKDKRGLWAFVEQEEGVYKVYNYTTGLAKVLGITGSEGGARASMVDPESTSHTVEFDGTFLLSATDPSYIKLKGSDNNYWNMRGNYLALWNSASAIETSDQGSQFFMREANYADFPDESKEIIPEEKEELEAAKIQGVSSFTPANPNTLWYTTSAEATGVSYPWMEYGLPLGNGELGCMVFGSVLKEELQFNEKTLWRGPANVVGASGGNRTFVNFGSLFIKNMDETLANGVTDYVRYLDIEEGIAGVEFKNANGTKQTRKYLSSAPDQVIAGQYVSEGTDKMHLLFKLEAETDIDADYVAYADGVAYFTGYMEAVNYAARLHVEADEEAEIITTDNGIEVKNATEVTFYLKGATNFNGDMEVLDNYFTTETPAQVNANVKSEIEAAANKGFEAVEAAHIADFRAITKRMTLDLGLQTPKVDTKTLIDNYYPNNTDGTSTQNDHLFLEQLYFHYGRYLAISSNRKPIAAPNNLQGIWNDRGTDSPWNSDVHTNINIQMNYWPTEITNLSDLHKPFVNFIIRGAQSEGWKQVAEKYNDGHGWSTLTETSLYNSMSTWGDQYLVANVWYTSHLWTHWRYTQDKEFLKKAFPVMWSAAEFWFHRLIEDKGYNSETDNSGYKGTPYSFEPDGTYVAPNEYSAEQNAHAREDGTAHAQQMISYLFENLKEAIDILGGAEAVNLTDEDIAKLDLYLEKTDKGLHTEIYTANTALNGEWTDGRNGVAKGDVILREWKYSPYDVSDDPGHRHMSHLMALFPMDQITPESEYFTPAVNSLKLRGDAATGWSMGWKVNLWARALDGDHAHRIIKNALKHSTAYGTNASAGGIYYNLFDSHAPFQIDGNFGVCSGIAEMLMQSAHGYINVLPALPKVWEAQGQVTGMKAMGNFTVDFNWKDGKAQQVTIVSNAGAKLRVRCNRGAMDIAGAKITVNGEEVDVIVSEGGIVTIPCAEGDEVNIDFNAESSKVAETAVAVSISDTKIGTFYANEAVNIAEGVKAYVAINEPEWTNGEGVITMTEITDGIIPAETGAVLRGEEGNYTFTYADQPGSTDTKGNLLVGYAGTAEHQQVTLPTNATIYVLAKEDDKVGFYRKDMEFKVYNHKAYLQVPATVSTNALRIRFADEETTSIDALESTANSQQPTAVYDLAGRRVEKMEKGIYIVNGRKVVK